MIGLEHYLTVATVLFGIGLWGMLTRRNILMVLLSIELILNAANLSLVAFSAHNGDLSGQAVVFFTMIVAAAEVTVGLSIVVLLYRNKETVDMDKVRDLKW
ncbi:MAG: NADH-quinone oxidoreductase subunit 11 [Candidatus Omnitrophica bacterium]|nr:NADH-quinone oxidoreductase subunit 11 [Candidatus Omnitrophota bacterium]